MSIHLAELGYRSLQTTSASISARSNWHGSGENGEAVWEWHSSLLLVQISQVPIQMAHPPPL
jgi:hypothetical protein